MKLREMSKVKTGKNFSRNKNLYEEIELYTYDDLTRDLSEYAPCQKNEVYQESASKDEEDYFVSAGDVVFSLTSTTAGIVSKNSEGKALNPNFAKLIIKHNQIDPRYLCYCLNQSFNLKKQMAVEMQGSTLPKLTPASLRKLDIPMLDLSQQQIIGHAYFSLLKRQYLLKQKMKQEEEFIFTLLETQLESETKQEETHG